MTFKFSPGVRGVRAALASATVTREAPGSGKPIYKDGEITGAETEAHEGK